MTRISSAVSVVIPTYNGKQLLERHLPSVIKALRSHDEVVIIDDASQDQTFNWLRDAYHLKRLNDHQEYQIWQAHPRSMTKQWQLTVILNRHNLRFGASCNRAVALAAHDLIFLINNDVKPSADVLKYLVPHFKDPQMFAVGCHEIEPHLGGISGGKNKLWFQRGLFSHSRANDYESGPTAWASGGSAMFDRTKWLELGGFDPAFYPAYWEDVDLSFRARKRGWKVWFEARANVEHNHETTNQDVFGQKRMQNLSWRHGLTFAWRHANWWQRVSFLIWQPYYWWQRLKA